MSQRIRTNVALAFFIENVVPFAVICPNGTRFEVDHSEAGGVLQPAEGGGFFDETGRLSVECETGRRH